MLRKKFTSQSALQLHFHKNISETAWLWLQGKAYTPTLSKIATAHSTGTAQVCLRWVLQRGAVMAIGTGGNAASIANYTKEDLDLFGFELTAAEMTTINALK